MPACDLQDGARDERCASSIGARAPCSLSCPLLFLFSLQRKTRAVPFRQSCYESHSFFIFTWPLLCSSHSPSLVITSFFTTVCSWEHGMVLADIPLSFFGVGDEEQLLLHKESLFERLRPPLRIGAFFPCNCCKLEFGLMFSKAWMKSCETIGLCTLGCLQS